MNQYDDLSEYLLRLGDSAVVQGQRLCEWCGRAPALEEEMALMNVGLDLFGQARNWLEFTAERLDDGRSADQLAFCRDERAYRNLLLVEQPNGDFAVTMLKQFFYDAWHYHVLTALKASSDKRVATIAAKALKEVTYHLRRSSDWVQRLGDGTEESHDRMVKALDVVWRFTVELMAGDEVENRLAAAGVIAAPELIAEQWLATVSQVLEQATLTVPPAAPSFYLSGREGMHTECLGVLLAEMQSLQRAYPDAVW
ncbi:MULTISPECIES: 1,2-phenylacetyl-CoA epoxidase subunit PaaC [unclassified Oceanobacter]|uniref:1,2-phenylacetyl-CoA epoxidase subunit PaaC n=1 Tax=unclassified Oceanobacter TaxID=2620260 RepID=UPI0027369884|nr:MULTISPECIES: 1,2-phenylacetyl-CoA epoxidase subunit PaaC [unclassified Oceanobacter]MDP2549298.1 1,2-phenylacetyl-CoA epoxidase subunit PaaC [Oceanobacter sp. 4_MG-2023]MDP2609072.1 1,2-phenylacetyl-CoA epoxidase subunit PaaC [Oceanobacter sp. 1_MG-2023]MDP2612394.1 1,2-phenylacetyl-CoA epoxidase subunit PaaC [Oceanobacter sp. 2_MG-2023]